MKIKRKLVSTVFAAALLTVGSVAAGAPAHANPDRVMATGPMPSHAACTTAVNELVSMIQADGGKNIDASCAFGVKSTDSHLSYGLVTWDVY